MEIRPAYDVDSAIASARGFASVGEWRSFRDSDPERQEEMIREMRGKRDELSTLRSDLEFMRVR